MIKKVLNYFLKVVGSAYLGTLALIIVVTPLRLITSNDIIVNVVSTVVCVITSVGCLLLLCSKDGYDDKQVGEKATIVKTAMYMSVAVVIYDLVTVLLQYYTGAAANVQLLAQILGNLGTNIELAEMRREHPTLMFVSLVIQTIPFVPAMIGGYKIGEKRRQKSREELVGSK